MKKASLLCLFLCCVVFSGCSKNIGENEDIYKGDLVVAGVGPEISFEPEAQEGTLVLKGNYEDHTDHIFLTKGMWEKFFKEESDYLPGNVVNFKGIVEVLDGAAGNHYYSVKTIDSLKLKKYSSVGEIRELIDVYSYCEKDSDCGYFEGVCPLGCYIPVNSKYIGVVTDIVSNFSKHLRGEMCIYGCAYVDEAICENYKCKLKSSEDLNESIICSPEEKSAEICTMQYDPVCGSDSRTYGNNCLACQSETVESYVKGECKSSAFSIEGDSKYLQEVEEILKKDGAVTCDLFYTNFGRQLHALFIADRDRFYSEKDDYSDNYRRNQTYNLLLDGKAYYRSTFPDSDNIIENSSVDIKSEIASILLDLGKYPDFQMNCSGGIENENLFAIPSR